MKTIELLNRADGYFFKKGIESHRLDAEILFCFAAGISREKLCVALEEETGESTINFYRELVKKRGERIPVAYLTGKKDFYDITIFLNNGCLIPRPETEQIIEIVFEDYKDLDFEYKIADLCAGPGTIVIPILNKFRNAAGTAADSEMKSLEALYTNAENYGLLNRLKIVKHNVLSEPLQNLCANPDFDFLVCNPPYISESEYDNLEPEIKYEPKSALIAESEGCIFYKTIIPVLNKIIKPGGTAYFEISESILSELELFLSSNYNYKIYYNLNLKPNALKILI
ncbi:MAG TPA: HemK/PrmC family methyltransferase [bacterium]|nr:HemK/PrmC family methyltransferase [bacterium]HPN31941.1 HemK/PrmC family methyltransferase [bacterium]